MNSAEDNQDELTSVDEVAEPPSTSVQRSPGSMLMAQRETLELSVKQVADQLNLTMHFIRSLESDSYEKLPGDVFVRGYIRTYARLLQLDPDQILMVYDEFNSQKSARKEQAIKRRNRRRRDKNRPWILVSGVAFISVAVALWFFSNDDASETAVNQTAAADTSLVMRAPVAELPALAPTPQSAQQTSPQQTPQQVAQQQLSASAALTDEQNSVDAAPGNMAAAPDSVAGGELAGQVAAPLTAATETTTTETQMSAHATHETVLSDEAGNTVTESWTGTDELRIGFRADATNVQVEHNGGSESHQRIHRAGEVLVIHGTAPFSVLLDDARDVSLSFNGRLIDISSNVRVDNSARLSIGM